MAPVTSTHPQPAALPAQESVSVLTVERSRAPSKLTTCLRGGRFKRGGRCDRELVDCTKRRAGENVLEPEVMLLRVVQPRCAFLEILGVPMYGVCQYML